VIVSSGLTVSRTVVDGAYLCDFCARALIAGAVQLKIVPPPQKPTPTSPPTQQSLFIDP
jgi:hypothetical protein